MTHRTFWAIVPPLQCADAPAQFWPEAPATHEHRDTCTLSILLPAADCHVSWLRIDATTPRQAAAAARAQARATAIEGDIHVVAEPVAESVPVATVSHMVMRHWRDWATANGYRLDAICPAAMALPEPAPGTVNVMSLAGAQMARTEERAFALEPELEAMLVGGRPQVQVDSDVALAALVAEPRLNLLTGPYAPPREAWFSRERLLAAVALVVLILLASLSIGLVRLVRTHTEIARIDNSVATLASTTLGRDVSADLAVAELDARLGATGANRGNASAMLAALIQAIEGQAAVELDAASWDREGTLTATLGATRADELNPVLLALQNAGYRITAQPRQGSDGRALGDITMRSEP